MRTSIVLGDNLVLKALKISQLQTRRELIGTALREFIENHSRLNLRTLKGRISFNPGYDYKSMRK